MKLLLGTIIGAGIGAGLHFSGLCFLRVCPVIGNPVSSIIIFSLVGLGASSLLYSEKRNNK